MFGYLSARIGDLTEEQLHRYRACYCGLCRSLQERHGEAARLTLSYDMCFLVLLLGSLYEPAERSGEKSCLPHPLEKRSWWRSEITDYAADLNLALAYLKLLDDWNDEGNPAALTAAKTLEPAYGRVCRAWPRPCAAAEEALEELRRIEQKGLETPDEAAACFGRLMGEAFAWREDRWSGSLRRFGSRLGEFIYLADACVDLDRDAVRNSYNPFRRYYGLNGNGIRFRGWLEPILGDCLRDFDYLPLVQDAEILKNILCSGLWTRFEEKYGEKREEPDGTGSL